MLQNLQIGDKCPDKITVNQSIQTDSDNLLLVESLQAQLEEAKESLILQKQLIEAQENLESKKTINTDDDDATAKTYIVERNDLGIQVELIDLQHVSKLDEQLMTLEEEISTMRLRYSADARAR